MSLQFHTQLPSIDSDYNIIFYTSQDSKLEFSEDEETLIIRMYNLVGESKSNIKF
ncbi:MYB transcription factor [Salix suchowensis]|nr:MYB transcription factor [Salix suchowensis]